MPGIQMPSILLVDDERLFVKGLQRSLEQEGYRVTPAYDGLEALEKLRAQPFDLVLLDLMLPGLDGLSVCRELRRHSTVPVIMLTARDDDVDKILGLETGADDYITKPFNTREVLARIRALLRRVKMDTEDGAGDEPLQLGDLSLDPRKMKVTVGGRPVPLTAKEFDLLWVMARSPGRVFTRNRLLDLVWGPDFFGDERTVDVHVRRLREKLEKDPGRPEYILTRWGTGYYFREMG